MFIIHVPQFENSESIFKTLAYSPSEKNVHAFKYINKITLSYSLKDKLFQLIKRRFISSLDRVPKRSHSHTNFMTQYSLDSFSSVKYIVLPVLTLKKSFLMNKFLR